MADALHPVGGQRARFVKIRNGGRQARAVGRGEIGEFEIGARLVLAIWGGREVTALRGDGLFCPLHDEAPFRRRARKLSDGILSESR